MSQHFSDWEGVETHDITVHAETEVTHAKLNLALNAF